jgi:hypothetical protein
MALSPEERTQSINEFRELYNTALNPVGFLAPPPVAGERVGGYRRRAVQIFADSLLPQRNEYAKIDYTDKDKVPFGAFKNFESKVLEACQTEAVNPANVPKGELKKIDVINNQTGRVEKHMWIGQDHFIKLPNFGCQIQMKGGHRPGRRVTSFWTGTGPPLAASGGFLR